MKTKKLTDILQGIDIIGKNVSDCAEFREIRTHSKSVRKGDIYVALQGEKNGNDFNAEAIGNGASMIITEDEACTYPHVRVRDCRKALALMAGNFYDNVHKKLKLIGVVGTNGKTTSTYILNTILKECGKKTAVIGTLGVCMGEDCHSSALTTPDPMELHGYFYDAYTAGAEYVIMEISAHAIFYKKLEGLDFDACIFTNISQDHLDFFKTMEEYAAVKMSFFRDENVKIAVVNADDEYGQELICNKKTYTLSYGINNPSDVFAVNIEQSGTKSGFVVNAFDDIVEISVPLLGIFNIYNVMGALTAARALGIELLDIAEALKCVSEIEGRFNIIKSDITVIIDYAHTPDGLENIIKAVNRLDGGKTVTVFGCGGNRDREKRPVMGKIASSNSDACVLTSDNPRYEEPNTIIRDIEAGIIDGFVDYICISDRKEAISHAIQTAKKGDKVLIAGKGGEDYIDIKGKKYAYSDKKVAEAALRRYREHE